MSGINYLVREQSAPIHLHRRRSRHSRSRPLNIEIARAPSATAQRLIIFNKDVNTVIETSIEYTPERLIEIYESLLAKSKRTARNWCLTMPSPPMWQSFARAGLGKKAKKLGLTEIS